MRPSCASSSRSAAWWPFAGSRWTTHSRSPSHARWERSKSSVVGDIYKVTFDKKDNPIGAATNRATFFWHIDRTDLDVPPFGSMLSAKVLTPTGGQTEFVNTYAAYEDLPDDEKERLDDLKVLHCLETAFLDAFPNPSEKQLAAWQHMPKKIHPLVWHHRSGRNSLVLSNSATSSSDWTRTRAERSSIACSPGPPSRSSSTRTSGRSTTSSSGTTPERCTASGSTTRTTGDGSIARPCSATSRSTRARITMIDKLEIQETISLYHEGGSKTDWDQVMATFLPDGIWEVPALRILSQGHTAIRETMTALMAPIEYLVQINAPAIITVDGDTASARSLIRECAKFRGQAGVIDVVGQFNDELRPDPQRLEVRRIAPSRSSGRTCQPRPQRRPGHDGDRRQGGRGHGRRQRHRHGPGQGAGPPGRLRRHRGHPSRHRPQGRRRDQRRRRQRRSRSSATSAIARRSSR